MLVKIPNCDQVKFHNIIAALKPLEDFIIKSSLENGFGLIEFSHFAIIPESFKPYIVVPTMVNANINNINQALSGLI